MKYRLYDPKPVFPFQYKIRDGNQEHDKTYCIRYILNHLVLMKEKKIDITLYFDLHP